ncbi:MAG: AAA family ATPase [Neomegalonema sp.]|nr:AAA family ATPase [Neomegalonema sp.]
MRFRRIELSRFGHFEDVALEIDATRPLTVIYGANEAGKSTLLQAMSDLLFGFKQNAPYANFRFEYNKLRIGAEVEAELAGTVQTLHFQRVKRKAGTLRSAADEPLPAAALEPFLGPIERDGFEQLFALDAERLRRGGEELLRSGGALGESLLSAGAALGDIHHRRQAFDDAADGIFGARKKGDRAFYAALERRTAAQRDVRERALTKPALAAAKAALKSATGRREAAADKLLELDKTRARDKRVVEAAKVAPEIDRLRAALAALGEAPDPALVEAAQTALDAHIEARRNAEAAARRADAARAELEVEPEPGTELAEAAAIEALWDLAADARGARRAAAELGAERQQLADRRADLAQRLGVPADMLAELRPSDGDLAAAPLLTRQLAQARDRAAEARRQLREATEKAAKTAAARDVESVGLREKRARRDAGWNALRAEIERGALPDGARLDGQEALSGQADAAADARIVAAQRFGAQSAAAEVAAEAVATAQRTAHGAQEVVCGAEAALAPLAAKLLPSGADYSGQAFEAALEAAIANWAAAARMLEAERELARRAAVGALDRTELIDAAEQLAARLGIPAPEDVEIAVRAWAEALKTARNLQAKREGLAKSLRAAELELSKAKARREAAQEAVGEIAAHHGVVGADGLAALLKREGERQELRRALEGEERHWRQAAEGVDEATLRAEIAAADLDETAARMAAGAALWRAAKDENDAAVAEEARADAGLQKLLESDRGAAAAARAEEDAAAAMALAAEEWLTLRAASLLLGETARRYRATSANPILTAASASFATLTRGAFAALAVDLDESGGERIVGVRGEGARVEIAAMSEGTRDQLFLALRLAAVRSWAAARPAPPFIADDLFASFDDERLAAGLEALVQLGAQTQCLVFTHHPHLVRLAETRFGDTAHICRLSPP